MPPWPYHIPAIFHARCPFYAPASATVLRLYEERTGKEAEPAFQSPCLGFVWYLGFGIYFLYLIQEVHIFHNCRNRCIKMEPINIFRNALGGFMYPSLNFIIWNLEFGIWNFRFLCQLIKN